MRFSSLVVPALAASAAVAQEQRPLGEIADEILTEVKGLWSHWQNAFKSAFTFSVDAGASKIASKTVTPLTLENWKDVLQHSGAVKPSSPPEQWMVYITGGNKTCKGNCGRPDLAWKESAAILAADASAPKLASLDCDSQELLCGAWVAQVPSIWFFLIPRPLPDQSPAPTIITIHNLNRTSVTNSDITRIHTRKLYLEEPAYDGPMHPFHGIIARLGLTMPLTYFLYGLSRIPTWAFMIILSIFSRYFVSKRMPPSASSRRQEPQYPMPGDARS